MAFLNNKPLLPSDIINNYFNNHNIYKNIDKDLKP